MTFVKARPGAVPRLRGMGQRLHTTFRRRLCVWLAGALLLTQWLVAAHACPVLQAPQHAPPAAAVAHAEGLPCHDSVSDGEGAVCKAQCTGEEQAPTQPVLGDNLARLAGWCIVVTVPVLRVDADPRPSFDAGPASSPPGWPPIYIVHGALRN
ncbi:MAG: hypothetical protein Q8K45_03825 [Rubrivivax sp.]|nr:hypothetical protein [Rubrivivax sp.]